MSAPGDTPDALLLVGTLDVARVSGALRVAGMRAVSVIDPEVVPTARFDAAIVDPDFLGAAPDRGLRRLRSALGPTPLVFLCGPCQRDRLAMLVAEDTTVGIIAREHVTSDEELRHMLLCISRGPTMGWEGLMSPNPALLERPISGSADRDAALADVATFGRGLGLRGRVVRRLQDVADELITNAVYDAPVDAAGTPMFRSHDRRRQVLLPVADRPTLRVARDPSHVAISVSDPFGSLRAATVRFYLAQGLGGGPDQVDPKEGGAGLGLTRVYEQVDRLTIKVRRGEATEVMAMIEVGGSRGDMAARPPTLVLAEAP